MAPRSISSDPLSSPSPSPTPEAEEKKPSEQNASSSSMAHLGSDDSELSELTEEEQEAAETHSKSTSSRRSKVHVNGRGGKPSRRGGRRKGSSLVPAPMWGWAETKAQDEKDDEQEPPSKLGKLSNLDEDEDEDMQDAPVDELDDELDPVRPDSTPLPPSVPPVVPDSTQVSPLDVLSTAAFVADTVRDVDTPLSKDADETDAEAGPEDDEHVPPIPNSTSQSDSETEDQPDIESESEADVDGDVEMAVPSKERIAPIVAVATASSITANSATTKALAPPLSSVASSRQITPASRSPTPTTLATEGGGATHTAENDDEAEDEGEDEIERVDDEDDDVAKPSGRKAKGAKAKGKARRKVKGGRAKHKPAPIVIPETTESLSVATIQGALDGEPTVEDPDVDVEVEDEVTPPDEARPDEETAEPDAKVDAEDDEEDEMEVDVEEEEQDPEDNDEPEREEPEEPEEEPEPEPAEDDDDDEELDLQPAHRVEALDMLATIELSFALVREKLYVEKMQSLAWEESLVDEGTHPELIYLQNELSRRKDKRLELAARKRAFEFSSISRKRKLDEDATWSWWKLERDELQTDMIAETNRKKRKLERDRRQMERPIPARTLPPMPTDIGRPLPTLRELIEDAPFSHKDTRGRQNSKRRHRDGESFYPPTPLSYPELPTLTAADVKADLDILYSISARRSGAYDSHGHGGHLPQPHQSYHGHRDALGQRMGPSSRQQQHISYPMLPGPQGGFPPGQPPPGAPVAPYENPHISQQFQPGVHPGATMNDTFPPSFGGKGLPHSHQGGPVPGFAPFGAGGSLGPRPDAGSGPNGASGSGRSHHHPSGSLSGSSGTGHPPHAFPGLPDGMGAPATGRDRERERERDRERHVSGIGHGRRSVSPPGGPATKESGQWMGAGMGMGGFGIGGMHGSATNNSRWPGEEEDRHRDKERPRREGDRERERREKEREVEREKQQRHAGPNGTSRIADSAGVGSVGSSTPNQGPPQGTASGSQSSPHSHHFQVPHHHHHGKPHHHHVLHHHHMQSNSQTNNYSHPPSQSTSPRLSRDTLSKSAPPPQPPHIGSRPPSAIPDERERERERDHDRELDRERDRPVPVPFALGTSQYAKIPPQPPSANVNGSMVSPRPSWGTPPPPKVRPQEELSAPPKSAGATPAPGPSIYGPSSNPSSPPRPPVRTSSPRSMNTSGINSRTQSPVVLRDRSSPPLSSTGGPKPVPAGKVTADPGDALKNEVSDIGPTPVLSKTPSESSVSKHSATVQTIEGKS
ncbi:hypothetical protein AAF712_001756 [Marasmius tenuissimus]|uniref:Uncharacterized protein n=1 Tax=Marasmius tenuissimus TaxID=585030 RepID=A0ABR3ACU6_9AGAR